MNAKTDNVVAMPHTNYRPSSKYPIRFSVLHPGSTFQIDSEPSRGVRHSHDNRVYRKSLTGFFSEDIVNGQACILMPNDMVRPVVKDNKNTRTAGDKPRNKDA